MTGEFKKGIQEFLNSLGKNYILFFEKDDTVVYYSSLDDMALSRLIMSAMMASRDIESIVKFAVAGHRVSEQPSQKKPN